jgi:hypothetical protein
LIGRGCSVDQHDIAVDPQWIDEASKQISGGYWVDASMADAKQIVYCVSLKIAGTKE